VINFKKLASVVVVFSLALCSCNGNPHDNYDRDDEGGSKLPKLVTRDSVLSVIENGVKITAGGADVRKVGERLILGDSYYSNCRYNKKTDETECTKTGNKSIVKFTEVRYNDQLFRGDDVLCILAGVTGEGKKCALTSIKCVQKAGNEGCESGDIEVNDRKHAKEADEKKKKEEAAKKKKLEKAKEADEKKKKEEARKSKGSGEEKGWKLWRLISKKW
jgi:hypothetical protein